MTSAVEILRKDYPELSFKVDGILPEGLSTLAGRPKIGKSWMALQLAYAVSTGQAFLGRKTEKGNVLYLALEDGERRLKSRMIKQNWSIEHNPEIEFITEWPILGKDALIKHFLTVSQGFDLTIVDTVMRVFPHGKNSNKELGEFYSKLQSHCNKIDGSILLIDHHRQLTYNSGRDPLDDIYGTTSKAGTIDTFLSLYKDERGKSDGALKIGGRDIQDLELQGMFRAVKPFQKPFPDLHL